MKKAIAILATLAIAALFATLLQSPEAVHTEIEAVPAAPEPVMSIQEQLAGLQRMRHDVRKSLYTGTAAQLGQVLVRWEHLRRALDAGERAGGSDEEHARIRQVRRDIAARIPALRARRRELGRQASTR